VEERRCYLGQNQEVSDDERDEQTGVGAERSGCGNAVWTASSVGLVRTGAGGESGGKRAHSKNQTDVSDGGAVSTCTAHKSSDGACLQVTSAGKVVYTQSVDSFETYTLGQPEDPRRTILR
jgi:hypothetical protein